VALNRRKIAEQNHRMLQRQQMFRLAADYVARALAGIPKVQKVVLFGSVANALDSTAARREGSIAVWHECDDVDLAVWLSGADDVKSLDIACRDALAALAEERQVEVAAGKLDVVLLESDRDRYLGHLCAADECPKGLDECGVPGCGKVPWLRRQGGFALRPEALAADRSILLFQRRGETPGSRPRDE
jgi:hypothetical protein